MLPATRKAMMLRFARAGAARLVAAELAGVLDPGARRRERIVYRGARLARMRCSVRRCMLSRRAVSDTLRSHIS